MHKGASKGTVSTGVPTTPCDSLAAQGAEQMRQTAATQVTGAAHGKPQQDNSEDKSGSIPALDEAISAATSNKGLADLQVVIAKLREEQAELTSGKKNATISTHLTTLSRCRPNRRLQVLTDWCRCRTRRP